MIAILSPSKTQDEDSGHRPGIVSRPGFTGEASLLVKKLRTFTPGQLQELLEVNSQLAGINFRRYMEWSETPPSGKGLPAILMYRGEVYNGLAAGSLDEADLRFAQDHIRILSGLYGMLRPLDLVMPYRLEMRTRLETGVADDLYAYWGDKLTSALDQALAGQQECILVNLASKEYFKALDPDKLHARIIHCHFREERNGKYRFVTVYGKKARGMMARYIVTNRITRGRDLKGFDSGGYYFNERLSGPDTWYFTR